MPTTEFADDRPALDYIKTRGYASYSSIKMVRDCEVPTKSDESWFTFGKELHSRDLEGKKLETLSVAEENQIAAMLKALSIHPVYQRLKRGAVFEKDFGPAHVLKKYKSAGGLVIHNLLGVPVFGRMDIWVPSNHVTDLKSTKCTNMKAFAESMDFLQAALYLAVTRCKNFYYAGICKQPPYNVMVFSVNEYPKRLKVAQDDLKRLLKYIKKNV